MMLLLELFSNDFNAWFSGSKIVNNIGEPLRVYHGTPHAFNSFNPDKVGSGNDQYGLGFYFTSDPDVASTYTGNLGDGNPNVHPVYLNMKNPIYVDKSGKGGKEPSAAVIKKLITSAPDFKETLNDYFDIDYMGLMPALNDAIKSYMGNGPVDCFNLIANDYYRGYEKEFLKNLLKYTPYDGVVVKEFEFYIAWDLKQIRSAFE